MLASPIATHKADCADCVVITDGIDCGHGAMDNVEDTGGEAGALA